MGEECCSLGGVTAEQIENILSSQLQFAKMHLTKKSIEKDAKTSETTAPANGIDNLLEKFLREAPGNGSPEMVHGFMRGVLFKYTCYVAYLGSKGKESEAKTITDLELNTWLNRCINTFLAGDDEQNKETPSLLKALQLQ